MFPTAPLTAVLLLIVSVAANPIVVRKASVSLPFARRLNITGAHDLIQKDQTRARNMFNSNKSKRSGTPGSVGITNVAVVYEASVGIGAPPTSYTLLVDTGSSNTWIGAGKPYVPTGSSVPLPDSVCVTYGSGSFCGMEVLETVTLSPTLVVHNQSIGIASTSTGFQGFDGILGLGPVDLTIGTLSPDTNTPIPTVTDNLFLQGTTPADLLSISFQPTTTASVKNGELIFGGTDTTQFTGPITTVPITTAFPASEFWGVDESIRYGASTIILASTPGIFDTGTTLILIATNGFNLYKSATGAVLDANTGLLRITAAQFSNLKSLFFIIGGTAFEFTANAQIWPRSLNTLIGGTASSIYLVVNDIGTPSGQGLDIINGYTFLERYYTIYDTTNKQVGIAKTPFTTATTN
ncbi:aspartic peptidase A1 [Lactarius pseudohatsudake]|nr:aspartic peptidase A1 [Lactarius pseudohatsudake]